MKKTIIYLIRHSEQLKFNGDYISKENEQIKNEKIVLSVDGEEKAKKLSKHKELLNIDSIFSSNYTRAICTAKYIAHENDIVINVYEQLGERKIGNIEEAGNLTKETNKNFTVNQLIKDNLKTADGESNLEVKSRMLNCINKIIDGNEEKRIAVVSHGAAIKFLMQNWCKYNRETDEFVFENKAVFPQKIASPSILKLEFMDKILKNIEYIEI